MTPAQMTQILEIMATADGGCYMCVSQLFKQLLKIYPEYIFLAEDVWALNYPNHEEAKKINFRESERSA